MLKATSMDCQPCHAPDKMSVVDYERQTMGKGMAYWESQKMRVNCLEYGVEVAAELLLIHLQSHHNVGQGYHKVGTTPPYPFQGGSYISGLISIPIDTVNNIR